MTTTNNSMVNGVIVALTSSQHDDIDNSTFNQFMNNANRVLHQLIPPRRNICYDLRSRHHDGGLALW